MPEVRNLPCFTVIPFTEELQRSNSLKARRNCVFLQFGMCSRCGLWPHLWSIKYKHVMGLKFPVIGNGTGEQLECNNSITLSKYQVNLRTVYIFLDETIIVPLRLYYY